MVRQSIGEGQREYRARERKSICTICSAGCGVIAERQNGVWVRQEVAQDHPISEACH
ncbi:MAG: hypothetical protein D3905_16915 [Candidatus Electrothrix sp. AS4_5]|nr:hypothetical protein [Candidatus Electrothrix gigas]